MTVEEAKKAIEQFRAQIKSEGYTDEEDIDTQIIATLGGMFIEDEIDVNQLNALMGLVGQGYELPEDFLAMSTEEQKANFFEEDVEDKGDYSKDEVEDIEKDVVGKDTKDTNNSGNEDKKEDKNENADDDEEEERKKAKQLFGM